MAKSKGFGPQLQGQGQSSSDVEAAPCDGGRRCLLLDFGRRLLRAVADSMTPTNNEMRPSKHIACWASFAFGSPLEPPAFDFAPDATAPADRLTHASPAASSPLAASRHQHESSDNHTHNDGHGKWMFPE